MNIMDMLQQTGGIEAMASQLGIPPAMAKAGAEAMLPSVLGGFRKQAEAQGGGQAGLGGLVDILGSLGGGALAGNVIGPEPTEVQRGNDILGQIFGTKEVSRTVAGQAAGQTGLDAGTLKKMLPLLAMLVSGYLAMQGGAASPEQEQKASGGIGGGLGAILGSVLGGGSGSGAGQGGLGALGSLLDMDGDGNPLDDILGMAGKLVR